MPAVKVNKAMIKTGAVERNLTNPSIEVLLLGYTKES